MWQVSLPRQCVVFQDAMQHKLQQAVQREKQTAEETQRNAVSQLNMKLQLATQQLADAQQATRTAQLEVDSLRA